MSDLCTRMVRHRDVRRNPFSSRCPIYLMAFGIIASTTTGAWGQPSFETESPQEAAESRALRARMEKFVDWDFQDVALRDAIQSMEWTHGIRCLIDRQAIEAAGASEDTPVSLTVSRIPLSQALRLLLQPHSLSYFSRHGIVIVTSNDVCEQNIATRVYPVKDLVQSSGGRQDYRSIVDLIKKCTGNPRPGWVDDGGVGTVEPFPTGFSLAVSATEEVHEQILGLLTALRSSRQSQGLAVMHFPRQSVTRTADRSSLADAQRSSSRGNSVTSARTRSGHLIRK
jgi:hypothetical protein